MVSRHWRTGSTREKGDKCGVPSRCQSRQPGQISRLHCREEEATQSPVVIDGTEQRIQEAPGSWSSQDKGKKLELPGEKEIWAVGTPEHVPGRKFPVLGRNHPREQRLQQ